MFQVSGISLVTLALSTLAYAGNMDLKLNEIPTNDDTSVTIKAYFRGLVIN